MNITQQAVTSALNRYEEALNASDIDTVMTLYDADGVLMPPYSPSAVGAEAVRRAYEAVFRAITLSVRFRIEEVVEIAPGWAFARTNSSGTAKNHATGETSAEGNQELFLFRTAADGAWRIARYSFSTTNPPVEQR